jgi:hypothetical protein
MRPLDTSPEVHQMQIDHYRRMTGEERMLQAFQISEDLAEFALAGIQARHPDYTDEDMRLAFRRMWFGEELFRQAWPDAPLITP